ncbi:UDP-N-acetylenolpyruvoylglucosamine reductase [bioreactor metagenome]|uniref:UDP-N-acetylenolpyruvoylglucosamine reductase n=2 Tax=root TaxID=1 RepID=A0A645JF46_9ZZZZ
MSAIIKYGYTVLEATFELQNGECEKIHERIDDLTRRRTEKQPLEYPSAGSTFKRPEGYFAAKLIEDSGLKGINIGDAEVSSKHSGFIINKGNANAQDILDLIKKVQETVKENFNVDLHTEVMIVGEEK